MALGLLAAALLAHAIPVSFTETSTATGTFNGSAFTNATLLLSGVSDTTAIVKSSSGVYSAPLVLSVSVNGVSDTFTGSYIAFSNPTLTLGGFAQSPSTTVVLATRNSAFATYDLASALGPIAGTAWISNGPSFATTRGSLRITASNDSTFTAVPMPPSEAVPEPSALVALGLGAAAVLRRRKRA